MNHKLKVLEVYNNWHENNRPAIKSGKWSLTDKTILTNPQNDTLRGLNLISYLPPFINDKIDHNILPKFSLINKCSGWIIPREGRHFTILDIIPHNSNLGVSKIRNMQNKYVKAINQVLKNFKVPIKIGFEGVFASPDGITIQGFPVNEGLSLLRESLRKTLASKNLINLENKKYRIETAHVAFIKFTKDLDGEKLLKMTDQLRNIPLGTFRVKEIVLNISPRYDKSRTIEIIKKYKLAK